MKNSHALLLSLLSGVLLWAAWPVSPFTLVIFVAFIPVLWLEHTIIRTSRFFPWLYLSMLVWNATTTWWVCNSTVPGGIAAIVVNSLLMCIPWLLYRTIKYRLGPFPGHLAFICCWISFEYFHLNWQLSWPWLTLGNVFAMHPSWVQWYEYTGSSGGSLWVLIVNLMLFLYLKNYYEKSTTSKIGTVWPLIMLILPVFLSFVIASQNKGEGTAGDSDKNIVIVQPNIDPYEKFNAASQQQQLGQLIQLSESAIDKNTALVVWPETAISGINGFNETQFKSYGELEILWQFLRQYNQVTLLTGVETYKTYNEYDRTSTARKMLHANGYYDSFNAAIVLTDSAESPFYHKSKLVPMVETMPPILAFFASWFEQFGGTTGGYVSQEERTVLEDKRSGFRIAPAICYESIYGEFLTAYVRNGANVIGIITNDGWWANTAGYRQHMQYARIRAIETRRWVIRSANTGISCFIGPDGTVYDQLPWDEAGAIKQRVPMLKNLTFFVRHEDIISKVALVTAGILLLTSIWFRFTNKAYGKNNSA